MKELNELLVRLDAHGGISFLEHHEQRIFRFPIADVRSQSKEVLVEALQRRFLEDVIDPSAPVHFADPDGPLLFATRFGTVHRGGVFAAARAIRFLCLFKGQNFVIKHD